MDNRSKTYAGFWQRVAAFALDYLIILGYLIAITLLFLFLNRLSAEAQQLFDERFQAQFVAFLLITFPVTLYFAIGESSVRQATWGKHRLALRIIDHKGKRIHFLRAFARTLLKFIPWEISHTLIWEIYFSPGVNSGLINFGFVLVYGLIGLNLASLVITKTHRTLYDFLTGTYVVK
jgi:uncharacterized RDD family membrane protein YckC